MGIVAASVISGIVLFERLMVYDFIIDGFLICFLFFKKINPQEGQSRQ